jgi:hypothetical protein
MTVGDLSRWGLVRPREGIVAQVERTGRIPMIDIGTVARIQEGTIRVRPEIRELVPRGARFVDGAAADYDAIVMATGYRPRLARLLLRSAEVLDERGLPRRHGREAERPGLFFVGFCSPVTGMLREIGREARRVARAIVNAGSEGRGGGA